MSDGSRLCLACGLCCDGTVFEHVDLGRDEAAAAARHLPVVGSPRPRFHQPCPRWSRDDGCTIYAERPMPCARYRCRTLERLDAGTIALEDALARVEQAHTLANRAWAQLPTEKGDEALYVASARYLRSSEGRRPARQAVVVAALLELAETLMVDFDVVATGRRAGR